MITCRRRQLSEETWEEASEASVDGSQSFWMPAFALRDQRNNRNGISSELSRRSVRSHDAASSVSAQTWALHHHAATVSLTGQSHLTTNIRTLFFLGEIILLYYEKQHLIKHVCSFLCLCQEMIDSSSPYEIKHS